MRLSRVIVDEVKRDNPRFSEETFFEWQEKVLFNTLFFSQGLF